MSDAFEIVMEAVPSVHVSTLLEEMGRMAESVSSTGWEGEPIAAGEHSAGRFHEFPYGSCMAQQVKGFRLGSAVHIPMLLIRVIRFEGMVSIELSFDMEWADIGVAMSELQRHFLELKTLSGSRTVYGGMEPAQDLETRFFTDDECGPLAVTGA
ncbi:hypothetical protein N5C16_10905 [Stenotrophomonas sp. GD03908]|uniref:Uncharacterized protein n=1 Tax=Stenotrophomonas maltophilia TaxID=40324 RepID=A0AAJ2WIF0_STEMA|nr:MULTISPECIES: hypothetical protein [Stenotrophomonas]MBH1481705.1 hypothetical protein [Stenotrophomonas maltophilia]MDH0979775.1 hypothetical protein [Stenotrophomonas sp. GD03908]MDQ7292497.1 hypothetical protein [Stenotrophomonas sp. Sm0041]MDZ5763666.1 hypothetical protein [Stenotrophomonas maltophilia]